MNDTIKEFLVGLGFDLDEAGLKKFTDGITTASTRAAALGAATTAAAAAIVAGVSKVAAEFNQLDLLAQKYNTTASEIDDFVDSAEMVGIGGEAAENALDAMNKVVGEAALGIGRGKIILEKLGIAAKDAAGKVRPVTDVMADLQTKLATMDRGQAMAIMEKMGLDPNLLRMFNGELGNLQKIQEEMSKTDASVGLDFEQAVEESKAFQDSMIKMRTEARLLLHWFTTLWESLAVKLMPKVRAGIERMGKVFEDLRHSLQDNGKKIVEAISPILNTILRVGQAFIQFFARGIEVVNSVVGVAIGLWGKLQDITGGLAGKILLVVAAWKFLNLNFLKSPLGMIVSLAAGALLLYDDFMTWKEGGESLIDWGGDFGTMILNTIGLVGSLTAAIAIVKGSMAAYTLAMNAAKVATLLFNLLFVASPFGLFLIGIAALIAGGYMLIDNWKTVKNWFASFFGWFGYQWDKVSNMASNMADTVGNLFGGSSVVAPSPQARAAVSGGATLNQATNIHVVGGSNPQATAQAVAAKQKEVNASMTRNVRGAAK